MYYTLILASLALSTPGLGSTSFILFEPEGKKIVSHLFIEKSVDETINAPDYLSEKAQNSVLKKIKRAEIETKNQTRQSRDTKK